MPLANFRKKISLLFHRFSPKFRNSNIFTVTEHTRNRLFNVHLGPIWWVPKRFYKIWIFIVKMWDFWVIFKNYSMRKRMLSMRGNDFIAHWAYEERISSHTEHTPNEFSRMLSQRKNVNSFYMYSYAEHMGKWFYRALSIRGNDFIAPWEYKKMI